MNTSEVTFVRLYITESSHLLNTIIQYLKDAHIRGVSVFRATSGYGTSGDHRSSWMDLSLDLPLTLEFFDSKETVAPTLVYLSTLLKPAHLVYWDAKTNL